MSNRRRRHTSSSQLPQAEPTAAGGSSSSGRHPVYRGIRLRAGKWVSEIRKPNKSSRIWLGTYPTPEMAAAAYDVAALALKGTHASLNFPESALSNTLPECATTNDIRAAAARAAASKSSACESGFVDDEALFDMPNLLSEMAQGMLLSPPRMNSSPPDDASYYTGGGNLWDY